MCTYTLVNSCLCSVFCVCSHDECILIALVVCDNVCKCVCIRCVYPYELYVLVFVCNNNNNNIFLFKLGETLARGYY